MDLALHNKACLRTVLASMDVDVIVPFESICVHRTALPQERKMHQHSSWSSPWNTGLMNCSAVTGDVILGFVFMMVCV